VARQKVSRKAHGAAQAIRLGKPCNAAGDLLTRSPFGLVPAKALGRVAPLARADARAARRALPSALAGTSASLPVVLTGP